MANAQRGLQIPIKVRIKLIVNKAINKNSWDRQFRPTIRVTTTTKKQQAIIPYIGIWHSRQPPTHHPNA